MIMQQARLVAKDLIPVENFDGIAGQLGLKYSRRSSKKISKGIPRHVWRSRIGSVTLVKDEPLELDYIKIGLPAPGNIERLLRASFPCYEWHEVITLVRSTSWQERDLGFRIVAELKYIDYDPELFDLLQRSVREADLDCSNALFAASRLSWHQLRPVVDEAAATHSASAIGDLAWNLLHGSAWDR